MRSALQHVAPAAFLGLLACGTASAQPSGEEIVRRSEKDHQAKDETGVIDMVLVSKEGEQRRRSMRFYYLQGKGDDDKHLLRFLTPPTIRNLGLLTVEATGRADDQWIYLPAFKKTKRIATSKRTDRFAETDFTFEDLRTEDYANHAYKLVGEAKVRDADCHVVEATPKDAALSGYARRRIHVEKARFLALKVEFFDKKERLAKTLENRGHEQVSGRWRPKMAMMEDHQRGTKTLWRFGERRLDGGLPENTFTVASLERGE